MNDMKEVNRFRYIGSDRNSYVVLELKPVLTVKADGRTHTGYGSSVFRLEDGTALIEQDEDLVFEIYDRGIIIHPA